MPAAASRRLAVLGSPEVAAVAARALSAAGHEIVAVVTRPDARRGRGGALSATPLKSWALQSSVPVFEDLREMVDRVGGEGVMGVVVAYGRLIPPEVLERMPMVNIHFSLLPRWRGAAPVERALLAGDQETGVCIMHVAEGLDTGAVLAVERTSIAPDDTAASLTDRLGAMGARLLVGVLARDIGPGEPQRGTVTYASKIAPEERTISWDEPARRVDRLVRALSPTTTLGDARIKVLAATVVEEGPVDDRQAPVVPGALASDGTVRCGSGSIRLERVQPAGKSAMTAAAWLAGVRWSPGLVLGSVR